MNSVQDNSQAIIIGPLPEGRFSRMHGIQDDKTPSPSYRVNEKKGKRASKRSVTIAFTVVPKNAGHECLSQACLRNNRRNLGVSQKPHGHANYLIFTESNIGAVLTIDQNMGTRVLGMRDLTYPTGTSTQICRPHSHKKSNHDFLHGITTLAFYPVANPFLRGKR